MSSPSPTPNRVQTKQQHGLAFRKVVAWMSVERDVEETRAQRPDYCSGPRSADKSRTGDKNISERLGRQK